MRVRVGEGVVAILDDLALSSSKLRSVQLRTIEWQVFRFAESYFEVKLAFQ